jgi:hypothetical protein
VNAVEICDAVNETENDETCPAVSLVSEIDPACGILKNDDFGRNVGLAGLIGRVFYLAREN